MDIRIYNKVNSTKVLGPGLRYGIWFQGCKKRCSSCLAPDSRNFNMGDVIAIDNIFQEIKSQKELRGITISGGEPFEQKEALLKLLEKSHKLELDTIVYTGYSLEELIKSDENHKILKLIDLLIDGEYIENLDYNQPLRGSDNQKFIYFSNKGENLAKEIALLKNREIEINLNIDGSFIIGIPNEKHKKI